MAENKKESMAEMKGLSEQSKFDVKKPLRGETNDMSQRPVGSKESVKTDRGSFTMK